MHAEINLVNVYSYLVPIAIGMIVLETLYCFFAKKNFISFADAITNIGTAIGNQCVNLLVAYVVIVSFEWVYQFRFFTMPTTVINFLILLTLFDFLFYWFHRHGHSINILWAAHMPHHTSEEMNIFVGIRASITQRLFSFTYMWPLALLGFRPEAIYAASAVQLIIALWHHTRVIGKMGWFEILFNSPSYHRVHHAINKKYLDKNFGEIFIIWDKLFGTCVKEDEPVVFGALTPIHSWNPNKIYTHFWGFLFEDMMKTKSWWDKIRLWFMPLGWRPEDVRHIQRVRVDAETLVKFDTHVAFASKVYLVIQAMMGLGLMAFTINLKLPLTVSDRLVLTAILWMMITSWGYIIENKIRVLHMEFLRLVLSAAAFLYLASNNSFLEAHMNIIHLVLASSLVFLLGWGLAVAKREVA